MSSLKLYVLLGSTTKVQRVYIRLRSVRGEWTSSDITSGIRCVWAQSLPARLARPRTSVDGVRAVLGRRLWFFQNIFRSREEEDGPPDVVDVSASNSHGRPSMARRVMSSRPQILPAIASRAEDTAVAHTPSVCLFVGLLSDYSHSRYVHEDIQDILLHPLAVFATSPTANSSKARAYDTLFTP